MTHPIVERARQILEASEAREREHEQWREEHWQELSDLRLRALLEEKKRGEMVFKTTWSPPPRMLADEETPRSHDDGSIVDEIVSAIESTSTALETTARPCASRPTTSTPSTPRSRHCAPMWKRCGSRSMSYAR
jgi:hypothetical protein